MAPTLFVKNVEAGVDKTLGNRAVLGFEETDRVPLIVINFAVTKKKKTDYYNYTEYNFFYRI